jgi:hypothetical protein
MSDIEFDIETDIDYAKIYKGKTFSKSHNSKYKKVIVFDLDETLGSFIDLEILWRAVQDYNKNKLDFFDILELYPEFLRYGIIPILEYLNQKKKNGDCDKVYIYTNNQCPDDWTKHISDYFNKKLLSEADIFDKVICAFKINNCQVELNRTTHDKTHNDFINCSILPPTTEICFIDNTYFSGMRRERVYYIQPKSYHHHLSTKEIIDRFAYSKLGSQITSTKNEIPFLISSLSEFFKGCNRYLPGNPTFRQLETDIYVAQKIMYHVKEFFYITCSRRLRTRKIKVKLGRFTRKK